MDIYITFEVFERMSFPSRISGMAYPPSTRGLSRKEGRLLPRRAPKKRGKPQKDRGQARNDKKAIKSKVSIN